MNYMNKMHNAKYDVLPVLEIVDQYLVPISFTSPWGYSSAYFLSAANNCHPNYAAYLISKHSLSMAAIGSILQQLPKEEKRFFNKPLIEKIYQSYQSNAVNDLETIGKLRKKLDGKTVLVICPGASAKSKKDKILNQIEKKKPYIISVNFIPDFAQPNLVFVGNSLRYKGLEGKLDLNKTIFTSNITDLPKKAVKVNYSELANATSDASDSSGVMLLKLLKKVSVKNVLLAGFDGFSKNPLNNYYNESYCSAFDPVLLQEKNLAIKDEIEKLQNELNELVKRQMKECLPLSSYQKAYKALQEKINSLKNESENVLKEAYENNRKNNFNEDLAGFLQEKRTFSPRIASLLIKRIYRLEDNSVLFVLSNKPVDEKTLKIIGKTSSDYLYLPKKEIDKNDRKLTYRILDLEENKHE